MPPKKIKAKLTKHPDRLSPLSRYRKLTREQKSIYKFWRGLFGQLPALWAAEETLHPPGPIPSYEEEGKVEDIVIKRQAGLERLMIEEELSKAQAIELLDRDLRTLTKFLIRDQYPYSHPDNIFFTLSG